MTTVNDLLSRTPGKLWTVAPGDTVFKALQAMANGQVGAVIVVESGRLAGIVTERDIARKVELAGKAARTTAVSEIMTADVVTVGPDAEIGACLSLMATKRIHHLPVIDRLQIVGVIDFDNLVNRVLADSNAASGSRGRATTAAESADVGPAGPASTGRAAR